MMWEAWTPWFGFVEVLLGGTTLLNGYYRLFGARIGEGVFIMSDLSTGGMDIGKLTIGARTILAGEVFFQLHTFEDRQFWAQEAIIGSDCVIRTGATVMGGSEIDDCCVIGTGSMVMKMERVQNRHLGGGVAKTNKAGKVMARFAGSPVEEVVGASEEA